MGRVLKLGAYLFHPLIIPCLAWMLYIIVQPNHENAFLFKISYKEILLFTIVIPILIWAYLKFSGRITSWSLNKDKQRRILLILYTLCLVGLLYLTRLSYLLPVKAFIYGLLCSIWLCLLLNILKFKISLHQLGISALSVFCVCLSIYFYTNLLAYLCILILANGWVASASLYTKKQTPVELFLGFMLGAIPQLYLVSYWL